MEWYIQQTVEKYFNSEVGYSQKIKGGMHTLYKFQIEWETYILKIRNNHHINNDKLLSNPNDIIHESNTLSILNKYILRYIPKHIVFLEEIKWLIMSCFNETVSNVHEMMKQKNFTPDNGIITWKYLAHIHTQLLDCLEPIRLDDKLFTHQYYDHRLNILKSHKVDALLNYLQNHKNQVILWDLNPANIFIGNDQLQICDFECVHMWTPLFDLGYLIAHIILHQIRIEEEKYINIISNIISQYEFVNPILTDETMNHFKNIILLILLNRLTNTLVNYQTYLNANEKEKIISLIKKYIDEDISCYNDCYKIFLQFYYVVNG
jgi:thiamine kinase-like enzyme